MDFVEQDRNVAVIAKNIQVEGQNKSLLFLHIKSLNLENMRFSFNLQDNDVHANFCFIRYAYNAAHTQVVNQIVQKAVTQIFDKGNYSSSLDRFIELLNRNIDNYVNLARANLGTRLLYGHFAISAENKLQYIYTHMKEWVLIIKYQYLLSTLCLLTLF